MPTDVPPISTNAHVAAIDQRVTGVERSLAELASATRDNFASIRVDMAAQANQLSGALASIQQDIKQATKPPTMPMIAAAGVLVAFLTALGGALYGPIAAKQTELQHMLEKGDDERVTKRESDIATKLRDYQIMMIERRLDVLERR